MIPITQTTPDKRWPISYNPDDGRYYVESAVGIPGMAIRYRYTHSHHPRTEREATFATRWGAQNLVRLLTIGDVVEVK